MALAPRRAAGANVFINGAFEPSFGAPAPGSWNGLRAYSYGLGAAQELLDEPLLGAGRDPDTFQLGAIDVNGSIVVPVDQRRLGVWLKLALGATQSSTAVGARGFIDFATNPADGGTITLGGTAWAFVTAAPAGSQTQIGADAAATVLAACRRPQRLGGAGPWRR